MSIKEILCAYKIILALLCSPGGSVIAASLGEVLVNDPILGLRTIVYEKSHGYGIVEGDIVIGRIEQLNAKSAVFLPTISGGRWNYGLLPFEIAEDLPFANKLSVMQAIDIVQKTTHIKFVELTSKNRHQYQDYLTFIPASGTTCASEIGKHGGRQEINLSPRCNTMNTVHEIGHALGLWHEQSREDRDSYIRIMWENIEPDHRYNFDQHLTNSHDYGEYDYQSIMHYPANAFSKNGGKTIIPLQEGVEIGQRNRLSDGDIVAINAMYPDR